MADNKLLLEVTDLKVHFFTDEGVVKAIDGVDMNVESGKTLCLVGESGCGKSVTCRAFLGIVQPPGRIVSGDILFHQNNADCEHCQAPPQRTGSAPDPGQGNFDDLPGTNDIAQPDVYSR